MRIIVGLIFILIFYLTPSADAHRSGCHRWHSCPSDNGGYICGDRGKCSQCSDNEYCEKGKPRSSKLRSVKKKKKELNPDLKEKGDTKESSINKPGG